MAPILNDYLLTIPSNFLLSKLRHRRTKEQTECASNTRTPVGTFVSIILNKEP